MDCWLNFFAIRKLAFNTDRVSKKGRDCKDDLKRLIQSFIGLLNDLTKKETSLLLQGNYTVVSQSHSFCIIL